jgi:dienelactone hydrolase
MQEETDDVLASLEFLKTLNSVDSRRLGIMGWSLGGIVSVLAASRSSAFQAVVDQAGAALTWDNSPAIQKALKEAAAAIDVPVLAMDAANDRTTESVKAVVQEMQKRHIPAKLIVYPPYLPPESPGHIAPGHLIFAAPGAHVWETDLKQFLGQYLGGSVARP